MSELRWVDGGGVTSARGFRAAGVNAGIRSAKPDVAIVFSEREAAVAGVFTRNRLVGSHVKYCRGLLKAGRGHGVVVNSGNANACTGRQGLLDAEEMGRAAAKALGVDADRMYVCSTGTIGIPMPMDKVRNGIADAAARLKADGGAEAARAIMTTDTVPKEVCVRLNIDGCEVTLGGMAKGSGMIHPNMATMLAFVTTDAAVDRAALQDALVRGVNLSLNRICVDNDQSPNDTVLVFANGAAGNSLLGPGHAQWDLFTQALTELLKRLAFAIVRDGEGATKFVTVRVAGGASDADAELAARAICNSMLVKTSWFGGDPNWGRVIDAVGYSGAAMVEGLVDISYGDSMVVKNGQSVGAGALDEVKRTVTQPAFSITVDLHLGKGSCEMYTCDCSLDYVKINADYMT